MDENDEVVPLAREFYRRKVAHLELKVAALPPGAARDFWKGELEASRQNLSKWTYKNK